MSFDSSAAINNFIKKLAQHPGLEPSYIEEIKNHFLDKVDHLIEEGYSEEEAFKQTETTLLSDIEELALEYQKARIKKKINNPSWAKNSGFLLLLPNYLKVALRNLTRNTAFSFINIFGLALGIACCLFILVFVQYELSFDRFHSKSDQLYRVIRYNPMDGKKAANLSSPLLPSLLSEFPGITNSVRMGRDDIVINPNSKDNRFFESNFYWTDSTFFQMFDFNLIQGNPETALAGFNSIVITQRMADKLFPNKNPMGEVLDIKVYDGDYLLSLEITGIVENPPVNSHIQFEVLAPFILAESRIYSQFNNSWSLNWMFAYVMFSPDYDVANIEEQIPDFFEKYLGAGASEHMGLAFQPLTDVRLYSSDISGKFNTGNLSYVYLFIGIAVMILGVACINFVNLSTARATKRSKEVGIRKALGAQRIQLIKQFLGESFLLTTLSVAVGLFIVALIAPFFNSTVGNILDSSTFFKPVILFSLFFLFILVGSFSGIYPAIYLSGFKPISILKSTLGIKLGNGQNLRKILVVFQFTVSAILVVGVLGIYEQFKLLNNKNLGIETSQVITVPVFDEDAKSQIDFIKEDIKKIPGVQSIAISGESLPSEMNNRWGITWNGKADTDDQTGIHVVSVDYDFFETLGADIIEGRNFSEELSMAFTEHGFSIADGFILNESAAQLLGFESPVTETVTIGGIENEIIGIVKDFNYQSLHKAVEPVAYFIAPSGFRVSNDNLILQVQPQNIASVIEAIKNKWDTYSPNENFSYSFVDDEYARLYETEKKFFNVFSSFSILAIVIASLGLFGLITLISEQKRKEIGIRKILGARFQNLAILLSKEFFLLVGIAYCIAIPLAYWGLSNWLTTFAYKISMHAMLFIIPAIVLCFFTIITIAYQIIKAATENPVNSLRSE